MIGTAVRYAPLLILAALWEAVTRLGIVPREMLPPLSAVFAAFVDMLRDGTLAGNAALSFLRGAAGLAAAIVVGFLLGAGMALGPRFHAVAGPLVQAFYPLPKTALVPLVMIWFGLGDHGEDRADLPGLPAAGDARHL